MVRIWETGRPPPSGYRNPEIHAACSPSSFNDEEDLSDDEAMSLRANNTIDLTHDESTRSTISPEPMMDQSPPDETINLTIDQLQAKWSHIHKPTDLKNQEEWSRPLLKKEKLAYMFWKFASQDSINEVCEAWSEESLTRPREVVRFCMSRLLAHDLMVDDEEEGGSENEDGEVEVELGEIVDDVENLGDADEEAATQENPPVNNTESSALLHDGTVEQVDVDMMDIDEPNDEEHAERIAPAQAIEQINTPPPNYKEDTQTG